MRVLLGIPSGGAPSAPFLESLRSLELPADVSGLERIVVGGNFVPVQRDLILERALSMDADVLAMCDDDMILPPESLSRLLQTLLSDPQCGLVGALYYSRDGFRPMVVDAWQSDDTSAAHIPAFDDRTPVTVDGVGFGCVVVRTSAFRTMIPPYFSAHVFIERDVPRVRVCDEDYLFCARLRNDGWRVVLDPAVRCGHFDRASGHVFPQRWESPETTNQRRMAVAVDGHPQLIPFAQAPTQRETHVAADVRYIFPEVPVR